MNSKKEVITLLLLIGGALLAQTSQVTARWDAIRRLEAQPSTLGRDTVLVQAYADFIQEWVKKELPDTGIFYADRAYQLARNRDWNKGILLSLIRKASCQNLANRHYEALRTGLTGLKLAEQRGDVYYQGVFHRSLGNNYDMLDNYARAIPHYETSLRLSERVPALNLTRAHVLVELGDAYRLHRKRPDRAKVLQEQAIAIYQAHDSSALGYAYDYYGQALTDLNLFRQAEEAFRRSKQLYDRFGKEYLVPELLLHEAELYAAARQHERAIAKARQCLAYSQRKKSLYGQRGAYRVLYQSSRALKQSDSALAHHEQFVVLNDSINETNNNQRFQAVQADYALQTQADTIARMTIRQQQQTQQVLLASVGMLLLFSGYVFYQNRKLRRKNAEVSAASLQGQTLERRRVAADLHDSLGGLLASLRWQMQQVDEYGLDEKQRGIFQTTLQTLTDAYQRVRLISHNLLPDELEKQGLAQGLRYLVNTLNRAGGIQIDLEMDGLNERLPKQTEFELYSISLELLTNVLKHAGATEAYLELHRRNGTLKLTVSDNGRGWDGQTTDGHGWKNIQHRLDSLGGQATVLPRAGRGTEVEIRVPTT